MDYGNVITILSILYASSAGQSVVNRGNLEGGIRPQLLLLKKEIESSFSTYNISLAKNDQFREVWNNASQVLEEIFNEISDITGAYQTLSRDPDAKRNATLLITSKGLAAEEHHVTTADGYILLMIRIKSPTARPKSTASPVFLLHGLLSSCDCYINNLRNESLAFILADLGYDVWLGNIRGNRYTTRHQNLKPTDKKFWEWSFDEMGEYDVPVMVDYILSQTGHKKLDFIGHSEGTTNLITSVIVNGQSMVQRINKFIALAPAIYVSHSKGGLKDLARFAKIIQTVWDPVDKGDVFAHSGIIAYVAEHLCYRIPHACSAILHCLVGPGLQHFNMSRIPVYLSHAPAGTSTQNMVHWSQQCDIAGDRLLHYDYGCKTENYRHYKQFTPPEYDLSKFIVPTYAFFGNNDWLVTPPDRLTLMKALPNLRSTKVFPEYNHADFVWGSNIAKTLYKDISGILEL